MILVAGTLALWNGEPRRLPELYAFRQVCMHVCMHAHMYAYNLYVCLSTYTTYADITYHTCMYAYMHTIAFAKSFVVSVFPVPAVVEFYQG